MDSKSSSARKMNVYKIADDILSFPERLLLQAKTQQTTVDKRPESVAVQSHYVEGECVCLCLRVAGFGDRNPSLILASYAFIRVRFYPSKCNNTMQ